MNKQNLLLILLVFSSLGFVKAQDIFIGNTQNRNFTSLNGKWEYVLDPYKTGQIGFMPVYRNAVARDKTDRVEYTFSKAQTLWVPGSWNTQEPELTYYEGNIWYRKTFDKEDLSENKRYFVNVGAANYIATVTFNGRRVGIHEGGFTPFSFEITDLIKEKDNFLIIGINGSRSPEYIPSEVTDWFNHGGITRDVKLIEVPKTFITNYFISLDKTTLDSKTKRLNGKLELTGNNLPESARIFIPE
ncbi:MAG TPA: beta-glucuronidase, partial [Draconibacterium sp.]|nr:beta-glucuronidase [Draconibacterium sp.]